MEPLHLDMEWKVLDNHLAGLNGLGLIFVHAIYGFSLCIQQILCYVSS